MKHPPYHLRTNKAVDRLTFASVVRCLDHNLAKCRYITLGGPFLEDLRIMDQFFPGMHLVSLEANKQTYLRQDFHMFSSQIKLLNTTLADYLTHTYEPGEIDVFWLDYTDLKFVRFEEFQRVLTLVPNGSVVRITLRAEPEIDIEPLRGRVPDETITRVRSDLEAKFTEEFESVLPHPPAGAFASPKDFAVMVQLMVRRAASKALDTAGSTRDFLPILSTRYNDQTQMISVTGTVYSRNQQAAAIERFKSVPSADFEWNEPTEINIPALSVKERMHLERRLPVPKNYKNKPGEYLKGKLKYRIDNTEGRSIQQLAQYAAHHRDYPTFIRLTI